MKIFKTLSILFLSLFLLQSQAQENLPKGFKKGSLVLADNTVLSGYIKENIAGNASVILLSEDGKKKKNYDGDGLLSVTIDSTRYICIKGDFFRLLCDGDQCLLQKSSDASRKPTYNGSEAIFSNGTEGKPGDYFIYTSASKQLKLITRKNFEAVVAESFAPCAASIEKNRLTQKGDHQQPKNALVLATNQPGN